MVNRYVQNVIWQLLSFCKFCICTLLVGWKCNDDLTNDHLTPVLAGSNDLIVAKTEWQTKTKLFSLHFSELNMIKLFHNAFPQKYQKKKNTTKENQLLSISSKYGIPRVNCKAPVMFQKLNYWTCLQIFSNSSSLNTWYFINFNYNKVPCAFIITTKKCYCEQKYGNKHANDFILRFG